MCVHARERKCTCTCVDVAHVVTTAMPVVQLTSAVVASV